jgi:Tol biopolymer transport system component
MTRRAGAARGATTQDPYGLGPVRGYVAPVVAAVALLIVGAMTFSLLNGQIPFRGGTGGPDGQPAANRTPAPSNIVIVEPEVTFPGSIVYAKAGNIWVQTGHDVRQLTDSGLDSMPSFSPDGQWVYFIRQVPGRGLRPVGGHFNWYDLSTPEVTRVPTDGSAKPQRVVSGRIRSGQSTWFFWIRQPVLSPNGHTLALISDGTDPNANDVVIQLYDTATKKFTKPTVSHTSLGHQDPAWRPDGKALLFVKNGRDGSLGAPVIVRYDPATDKSRTLTGPGYIAPAWSPDGGYIAATKTDSFGTDIAILDAKTGAEVLRVTNDDHSFSPVWSPAGDAIAFLHIEGMIVDLKMVALDGPRGAWTVGKTTALTNVSGLDAGSRPSWFVPASQLPAPSVAPSGSGASPSPSASTP